MAKQEKNGEQEHHRKMVDRFLTFNDAVFAIALTLLVLELRFPDDEQCNSLADMWHCLQQMEPKFLAFILSAILVGGNWISAINLQKLLVRFDFYFMVDLVIYLIIISLMPFCCYLIGNFPDSPLSFVVFGIVSELLIVNAFFFIRHCRVKMLVRADADLKEMIKLEKTLVVLFFFIAGLISVAFYNTRLCLILFLLFNLIPFFITRSLKIKPKD